MFSFLTPYMTYIKLGLIVAVVIIIAALYALASHYKNVNKVLASQIIEVRAANAENVKTIDALKADSVRSEQLCETRLAIKDKVIAGLRKINALSPGGEYAGNVVIGSGNPILDALNGMYPKAGYQGGVCKAGSPGPAGAGAGQSGDVLYCFSDKQDILNYLYNKALHDGREAEMESILKSFQK
jgi:hypothetical protein